MEIHCESGSGSDNRTLSCYLWIHSIIQKRQSRAIRKSQRSQNGERWQKSGENVRTTSTLGIIIYCLPRKKSVCAEKDRFLRLNWAGNCDKGSAWRPQTTTNDRRRPQTSIEMTANDRKRLTQIVTLLRHCTWYRNIFAARRCLRCAA